MCLPRATRLSYAYLFIEFQEEENFGPMYQEFFENNTEKSQKKTKSKKSVRFEMDDDNVSEDDNEENTTEIKERDDENLSTLEKRSERLNKRIAKLEEEAVSEKPWALKGEVAAKDRPQNSLLEEAVEFDVCTRPGKILHTINRSIRIIS